MDVRWQQRLNNYHKAFAQLMDCFQLSQQRALSPIETQGLIKAFEFTHELAWNVMKDFFKDRGNSSIMGSKDATREAFKFQLITDGDGWMDMIASRNQTSHTYNENVSLEISQKILKVYIPLFAAFAKKMEEVKSEKS